MHLSRKLKSGIAFFDFDDTLTLCYRSELSGRIIHDDKKPNLAMLSELFRLAIDDWRIFIITERQETEHNSFIIKRFITEYGLPIAGIFYVGNMSKGKCILEGKADLYYEDDQYDIDLLSAEIEKRTEKPNLTVIFVNTDLNSSKT